MVNVHLCRIYPFEIVDNLLIIPKKVAGNLLGLFFAINCVKMYPSIAHSDDLTKKVLWLSLKQLQIVFEPRYTISFLINW